MFRSSRFLVPLAVALSSFAGAQTELPHMKVELDGLAVDVAPMFEDLNMILVPLRPALQVLTGGDFELKSEGDYAVITLPSGIIRIPSSEEVPSVAEVRTRDGSKVLRTLAMNDIAREIAQKPGRLMVELNNLAALLGVTVDVEGSKVALFTPRFWSSKLGLKDGVKGAAHDLMPAFGISPPAETLILFARPEKPAYVQIYALSEGTPKPMFAIDPRDRSWVTFPRSRDVLKTRPADDAMPARAESRFFGFDSPQYGEYVAIVTREEHEGDLLAQINDGTIAAGDWILVGLRQRALRSPISYKMVSTKEGDRLSAIAREHRMSPNLLQSLNGFSKRTPDQPPAGTRIVVIEGTNEEELKKLNTVDYEILNLHEVQPGETIARLAEKWRVDEPMFLQANPSIPAGAELEPGELVNVVRRKGGAAPAASTTVSVERVSGFGRTKAATVMKSNSSPDSSAVQNVGQGVIMTVLGRVPSRQMYQVSLGDVVGYVPYDALNAKIDETDSGGGGGDTGPIPNASDSPIANEALRYVGTRYQWGGNCLTSGIDCSHFVSQVLRRTRNPAPSPPVVLQENQGDLVHYKPGPARRGGRTIVLPSPQFPTATSAFSALKPGDRIIIQRGLNERSGSRHTGLYIGRLVNHPRFGTVRHAVVHASSSRGVTVNDIRQRFMWKDYKFSVRSGSRTAMNDGGDAEGDMLERIAREMGLLK